MPSTTIELRQARVDTFDLQVFKDAAPYNLDGCAIAVAVKLTHELSAPVLFRKVIGQGITLTDPAIGRFRLVVAAADKAALNPGTGYFWETLVTLANGDPITPDGLEGEVAFLPSLIAV